MRAKSKECIKNNVNTGARAKDQTRETVMAP